MFQIGEESPFFYEKGEGFDEGSLDKGVWIVNQHKPKFMPLFDELKNSDNKVNGKLISVFSMRKTQKTN